MFFSNNYVVPCRYIERISWSSFSERVLAKVNIEVDIYYSFIFSNIVGELRAQLLLNLFFMEWARLLPSAQERLGHILLSEV